MMNSDVSKTIVLSIICMYFLTLRKIFMYYTCYTIFWFENTLSYKHDYFQGHRKGPHVKKNKSEFTHLLKSVIPEVPMIIRSSNCIDIIAVQRVTKTSL